ASADDGRRPQALTLARRRHPSRALGERRRLTSGRLGPRGIRRRSGVGPGDPGAAISAKIFSFIDLRAAMRAKHERPPKRAPKNSAEGSQDEALLSMKLRGSGVSEALRLNCGGRADTQSFHGQA